MKKNAFNSIKDITNVTQYYYNKLLLLVNEIINDNLIIYMGVPGGCVNEI